MLNKELVKKHFSKSAPNYDKAALLQRRTAAALLERVFRSSFPVHSILDIGTGTGFMALGLQENFPNSRITACDLAPGMVKVAQAKSQSIDFLVCDAESLPFTNASFDLVVSSLAFQWMNAARVLSECQRVLKPKGKLYFTTLGPQTLRELREIFPDSVIDFCSLHDIEVLLAKNRFCNIKTEQVLVTEVYSEVKTLMYSLKNIGAQNGNHTKKGLTGAKAFMRQMEDYRQKFGRNGFVTASFEIIFGEGQR